MTLSFSTNGTMERYGFKNDSTKGEDFLGLLKLKACEAFINSIAKMVSMFSITRKHFVAPFAPILTWSSCPFEETMESTEAGVANCLFWLTILAAVYCGIINPLLSPGLSTKKAGKSRRPETS